MNQYLKRIFLPGLIIATCLQYSCNSTGETEETQETAAAGTLAAASDSSSALECPNNNDCVIDVCAGTDADCDNEECLMAVACCHEIDSLDFVNRSLYKRGLGTGVGVSTLRNILDGVGNSCEFSIAVIDSTNGDDSGIYLTTIRKSHKIVTRTHYSVAMFKGILLSHDVDSFYFKNAKPKTDASGTQVCDILIRAEINGGRDMFYDLSEPPSNSCE